MAARHVFRRFVSTDCERKLNHRSSAPLQVGRQPYAFCWPVTGITHIERARQRTDCHLRACAQPELIFDSTGCARCICHSGCNLRTACSHAGWPCTGRDGKPPATDSRGIPPLGIARLGVARHGQHHVLAAHSPPKRLRERREAERAQIPTSGHCCRPPLSLSEPACSLSERAPSLPSSLPSCSRPAPAGGLSSGRSET